MRFSSSRLTLFSILALAFLLALPSAQAAVDPAAVQRLLDASDDRAEITIDSATGMARFVRLEPGSLLRRGASVDALARDFFAAHGEVFGITDPANELGPAQVRKDVLGHSHATYAQLYRGLPVFGGIIRVHTDREGRLTSVNGVIVPDLALDPRPRQTARQASGQAMAQVRKGLGKGLSTTLSVAANELMIFRAGLVKGVPGPSYLAWEVEVTGVGVREFVYVDAHSGKVIDQITGIHDAIDRAAHENMFGNIIWNEGDVLPYDSGDPPKDAEITNMIISSGETYDFFLAMSGNTFPSYDGADATMNAVFNAPINCPNASWNGISTNFCPGVTSDDVVGHEWAHAYTDFTHNLIYQWQPGALNEAYSDIYGEVVDFINGRGTDTPDTLRVPGGCSTFSGSPPPGLTVNSPPNLAGTYVAGGANFNPPPPSTAIGNLELVDDGTASPTQGCSPLVGFTPGNIALIDRGGCPFVDKTGNAETAGAAGVIIVNNVSPGVIQMGGAGPLGIPSVMSTMDDGQLFKDELGGGGSVNATIELQSSSDSSLRWLVGEDDAGFGGAIRDMWNPPCLGDPGKVSDVAQYACGTGDSGGVHTNSGIANHAFALLVDGGTYNGVTVQALGSPPFAQGGGLPPTQLESVTKASQVFWRAMSVYQTFTSDFIDHADALEQSCSDLLGSDLPSIIHGGPSGFSLTAGDCQQVSNAIAAVEYRLEPTFCNFQPILDPNAPALTCGTLAFYDDFETNPAGTWTLSNMGVFMEYNPRDWLWTSDVPDGGTGSAFFGIDSIDIGDCVPGSDDQSGVMHLDSPVITIPAGGSPTVQFDHSVATEALWDGANVKVSVNGGAWQLIPAADFIFNPYNGVLNDAGAGNTNPIGGEEGWTGSDLGSVSSAWGRSQIDLSGFATSGDDVQLRFDLGVDGCNGLIGWYVDNVQVCSAGGSTADISLEKTGVANGTSSIVYTFTVTNMGPGGATNAIVTDNLPAGVTYVSDTCGGSYGPPWTWNVPTLPNPGDTATCDVTVSIDSGTSGSISNTATVAGDQSDPVPADNDSSVQIEVRGLLEIPTLGEYGLLLLILCLAGLGVTVLRRQ